MQNSAPPPSIYRTELSRMMVFVEVVRHGSFVAAAQALGVGRSSVSTAISELENTVGARLLQRSPHRLQLTEIGATFHEHCVRIAVEAEAAFAAASAVTQIPTGTLRVTCPGIIADQIVTPVLRALAQEYQLRVDLRVDDRRRDLIEGGFDAALRVGHATQLGMTMRKLGSVQEVLVATPQTFAKLDGDGPEALQAAQWIMHSEISRTVTLHDDNGAVVSLTPDPIATVDSCNALVSFIRAGVGIGLVPNYAVRDDLDRGDLVEVLPAWKRKPLSVFVLLPSREHQPLRTKLFIDAIAKLAQA